MTETSSALSPVGNRDTLQTLLNTPQMIESMRAVLPKHLTPERMLKMAMVSASRTPKLYSCTRTSVLESIMQASELGLDISGTLGSAWLIPYGNVCRLIPGYRGLIDLATRSGQVLMIEARVVHQRDRFDIEYGTNAHIMHIPSLADHVGEISGAYAVATRDNGVKQFEWMSKQQVDGIRAQSKAANDGPWISHYDEMARKTAVRRLCKYLPISAELGRALSIEDDAEGGMGIGQMAPIDPPPAVDRGQAILDKVSNTAFVPAQTDDQLRDQHRALQEKHGVAPEQTEPKRRGRQPTRKATAYPPPEPMEPPPGPLPVVTPEYTEEYPPPGVGVPVDQDKQVGQLGTKTYDDCLKLWETRCEKVSVLRGEPMMEPERTEAWRQFCVEKTGVPAVAMSTQDCEALYQALADVMAKEA